MKVATTLFAQAYAPYLALGIGALGGRAAVAGCLDGFGESVPWAACDTQTSRLLATGLERKLLLERPRSVQPEILERAVVAQADALRRLLRKKELILLFGALEESLTAPIMHALSTRLHQEGRDVCAIGLEPMVGSSVVPDRFTGPELMLRLSPAVQMNTWHPEAPASQISRIGEESLSFAVEALLAALVGCDSAPGFSFEELRTFLLSGPAAAVVSAAEGREAIRVAFEQTLNCAPWTNGCGVALAVASGKEYSVTEVQGIRSRLAERYGAHSAFLIGFGTDPALGEDARCLLMQRPQPSKNVIYLNR